MPEPYKTAKILKRKVMLTPGYKSKLNLKPKPEQLFEMVAQARVCKNKPMRCHREIRFMAVKLVEILPQILKTLTRINDRNSEGKSAFNSLANSDSTVHGTDSLVCPRDERRLQQI